MPYEAVADDLHIVLHSEFHKFVGKFEVPDAFCRVEFLVLHTVLGNDGVEVLCQGPDSDCVKSVDLPLVDGSSDGEVVLECLLEGRLLSGGCAGCGSEHSGCE